MWEGEKRIMREREGQLLVTERKWRLKRGERGSCEVERRGQVWV